MRNVLWNRYSGRGVNGDGRKGIKWKRKIRVDGGCRR